LEDWFFPSLKKESSITPKRLSRFGVEVDEALRVGGSGFLGESDALEAVQAGCRQNQKASEVSFSTSQRR